jgi:arylsulfatase A-like enzyme
MNSRGFHTARPWIRQEDWGSIDIPVEEMPDYNLAQWAKRQLQQKHVKPLFLAVGFFRPHMPWYVPQKYFDLFPADEIKPLDIPVDDLDDVPEVARRISKAWGSEDRIKAANASTSAIRAYLANIAFVDDCLGIVLDALQDGPYSDNTFVVVWSDNGFHLGEKRHWHKNALWEPATRVPLLLSGPQSLIMPRTVSAPVGLIDLYPTLCDLCDIAMPEHLNGKSLKPLITGSTGEPERTVVMYKSASDRAIRFQNWRYIRYADGSEELYDIHADPDEFRNLANSQHAVDVMERARKLLGRTVR